MSSYPGLVQIAKRTAFIRLGSYQVVHLIDLNKIELVITEIERIAEETDKNNEFRTVLLNKSSYLKKVFNEIKPTRSKRSWEGLGSGIKWMAGNPDADDTRYWDNSIDQLKNNQNKLVNATNEQIEINKIFEDRLNLISETLSKTVASSLNETFNSLEIVNLIFNIDAAVEKLVAIKEAIKNVKLNVISENLLEKNEVTYIKEILAAQNLSFPSTQSALSYLEPHISYRESIIRYKIKIPQVSPPLKLIHIEPIPVGDKIIKIHSNEVLLDTTEAYFVENQCSLTENPICKLSQLKKIVDQECIPAIMRNAPSRCTFMEDDRRPAIITVDDGVIITKNVKANFTNTCGAMNHTIQGSMLISFKQCTVIIGEKKFENKLEEIKINLIPFFAEIKQRDFHKNINLEDLHDLHLKHRGHLEQLEIRREKEKETYYIAAMVLAVIITIVISSTIYIGCKIRIPKIKITRPEVELKILPHRDDSDPKGEKLTSSTSITPTIPFSFPPNPRSP